ncbi:MAG: DUF6442 family protein [Gordonibacter sp.]|uniref:DUF6442 family protein n=1 Tax=Gordonibacter sp. TaxID=1968902 RepID=UPI002FCBEA14
MDKDEILEKSRKDSGVYDERFMLMNQRANAVMATVMMMAWAIVITWDYFHDQDVSVANVIMMSGMAALCFCRFAQFRDKGALALGALAALGAVVFFIKHILATM